MKKIVIVAPLFIIFAAFLWALDGIVIRPSLYTLPVSLVVFLEHGLALVFLLPFLLKEFKAVRQLKKSDWAAFFWVAIFGGVLGTMFITKALFYVNFVNLSIVVLIQKLQPVFALLLAWLFLKERMPKRFFFLAALAVVTTYFITFGLKLPEFNTGDKTLGAAFAWGSATVFSKRALQNASFKLGTYLRFALTTALMFIIVLANGSLSAINQVTPFQWRMFFLIVFSSGAAAMFFYYYGLKRVKASVSTICELTFPLAAILLEFLVHGRALSLSQWLGVAVLFFTIYQVALIQRNLPAPKEISGQP